MTRSGKYVVMAYQESNITPVLPSNPYFPIGKVLLNGGPADLKGELSGSDTFVFFGVPENGARFWSTTFSMDKYLRFMQKLQVVGRNQDGMHHDLSLLISKQST
jgi:hypothetical protein